MQLQGDEALSYMLSMVMPQMLPHWDGKNERVIVIERDGDDTVKGAFSPRRDAVSTLRRMAHASANRPHAELLAKAASDLSVGPPASGNVQVLFLGPLQCGLVEIAEAMMRDPPIGVPVDEFRGLLAAFQASETAVAALEREHLLVCADLGDGVPALLRLAELAATRWSESSALAVATAKASTALESLAHTPAVQHAQCVLDALRVAIADRAGDAPITRGGSA